MPVKGWEEGKVDGYKKFGYAEFRRQSDRVNFFTDLDSIEYRKDRGIVAILEVTANLQDEKHMINSMPWIWRRLENRIPVFSQIAISLKVPFYLVVHDVSVTIFHVYTIIDSYGRPGNKNYIKMDREEHRKFINNL